MALNLPKAIIECLKENSNQKLKAREIAEWIFKKYPKECQEKKANSKASYLKTDADLVQQIVAEIGSRRPGLERKYPRLKTIQERPRKYYYSEKTDGEEVAEATIEATQPVNINLKKSLSESDLYPLLSEFLWNELKVYSKRIDEKRSSNKKGINGNRWLHPDIVF